jgi:hypothetical protein
LLYFNPSNQVIISLGVKINMVKVWQVVKFAVPSLLDVCLDQLFID